MKDDLTRTGYVDDATGRFHRFDQQFDALVEKRRKVEKQIMEIDDLIGRLGVTKLEKEMELAAIQAVINGLVK